MKEMKAGVTSMLLAIIQGVQGRVGTSRKPKAVAIASMPAHLQNDIGVDTLDTLDANVRPSASRFL
ncbi:hypothetical protein [Salinivibrio sp. ES.052]|uniref:hypothetical protein n=1 Tax=Salinivibrio sp. ES.052 TaxID=1882823 RepID=UPI00092764AE|nr:hypothetical protein [Salinivibrio sp. ES.052]SIO35111.1 hypothetical protein SAMN05444724_2901 [Salinivibrio sp. ES.052]